MAVEYTLIRSQRLTAAIEIKRGEVIVRVPLKMKKKDVESFVERHKTWIENHLSRSDMQDVVPFTDAEIASLAEKAKAYIPSRVKLYAERMNVNVNRVTIRAQRTKWGSCSGKGNLNFNCLLMLTPPEVIDSVVVHELCHLKEMNHSKKFYAEVEKYFPNYAECKKWMKENGAALIAKLG